MASKPNSSQGNEILLFPFTDVFGLDNYNKRTISCTKTHGNYNKNVSTKVLPKSLVTQFNFFFVNITEAWN